MQAFRAHLISSTPSGDLLDLPDGILILDDRGCIAARGPAEMLLAQGFTGPLEDLRPQCLLPGLVDLHLHLPQYDAVALDGLELLPWLETHIFPAEACFADPEVARASAKRCFQALARRGTTTAVIYGTVHETATDIAFQEAERSGLRIVMGKVLMDRNAPGGLLEDTADALRASERLCERWNGRDGGRLTYAFTPRFAPSCTPDLLRGAARLAERHGAYLQTHLSENLHELAWVQALFPGAAHYTDVYHRMGLLGPRTLLAHGIHLTPEERALLKASGSHLVHCPRSNAFLASGIMPLRRWLNEGLSVGLGTDIGAGPSLSMWAEAAFACMASKLRWAEHRNLAARLPVELRTQVEPFLNQEDEQPLRPTEAFHLATLGGARALGWMDRIGSLEVGREADLVLVDPRTVDPAPDRGPEPAERVLSRLFYRERPELVKRTYVRGRLCWMAN